MGGIRLFKIYRYLFGIQHNQHQQQHCIYRSGISFSFQSYTKICLKPNGNEPTEPFQGAIWTADAHSVSW